MVVDPSLALPARTVRIAPLVGPGDTLVHAGAARPRPFRIAAPGVNAQGVETRALDVVELGDRVLLGGITVAGATCSSVLLSPSHARRELTTPSGSVFETLLVTRDGMVAQWTPGGAAVELVLRVPGAYAHADGPFLRVDGADGVRLFQITPAPIWRLGSSSVGGAPPPDDPGGALEVVATLRPAVDALLAAAGGSDGAEAEDGLRRLGQSRESRAEADLVELRTRRLAVHTGVAELDDGLPWAIARVEAWLGEEDHVIHGTVDGTVEREPFPLDPEARRAWTILGGLAAGSPRLPPVDSRTVLGALVRARLATTRGGRLRSDDLPALAEPDLERDPVRRVTREGLLLTAADALEPWEGRARAEALRERAAVVSALESMPEYTLDTVHDATRDPLPNQTTAAGRAGARLPILGAGSPPEDPVATALAAALELPGRPAYHPPADDPPPGLLRALAAWACLTEGHVERGFALFRRHLADGFAQGAGLWPDGGRAHDSASAALVPIIVAHGLLGIRADAHYLRLRLAPRLPAHWSRLTVRGIAIGDASVRMEYEELSGEHRFRFVQESGAVPVMLVCEPLLPVTPDARARVDGRPAELDLREAKGGSGGRRQVRVQLPLDRERVFAVGPV